MKSHIGSQPESTFAADLQEMIRNRAEEIYLRTGCIPGRDLANWAQAELEISNEMLPQNRTAVVVRLNGVRYVGEYSPSSADGYVPGEWSVGQSVPIRFEGDKMYVERPDGRELMTTIVQKLG